MEPIVTVAREKAKVKNAAWSDTGKDHFLSSLEKFRSGMNGQWSGLRRDAASRVRELGFPTSKHEEWKYTNLLPVLTTAFHINTDISDVTAADIRSLLPTGKDTELLVFVNGVFHETLSTLNTGKEVIAGNLAAFHTSENVNRHLSRYAPVSTEPFVALNTAFLSDGAFIYLPEEKRYDRPLHILHLNDGRKMPSMSHPRNLIVAGKGVSANITESYHSLGTHTSFTNVVTEVILSENASLELTRVQTENRLSSHISFTEVRMDRDTQFRTNTITLDGNFVRNNLHIVMDGTSGSAILNGLYIADKNQVIDNHTLVDHASPNCFSKELYKGILDDKAQGVFNGKIFVRQDAQKTNAYQSNKNILLSNDAVINTKPQLEIFADDVKCSHGATAGQLDEEALFYLRSRGIGLEEARVFLNIAFAAEVIRSVSNESLREYLMRIAKMKLRKEI